MEIMRWFTEDREYLLWGLLVDGEQGLSPEQPVCAYDVPTDALYDLQNRVQK